MRKRRCLGYGGSFSWDNDLTIPIMAPVPTGTFLWVNTKIKGGS